MIKRYPEYTERELTFIGEMPKQWDTVRCAHLFEVKNITNTSGEINLSVYRDYGVIKRDSRADNYNRVPEDTSNYKLVEQGDFVFNKMKCWQGSLGVSEYRGIVSPAYTVCSPKKPFHGKYLHYLLRSRPYVQELKRLSYGVRIGQWELRFKDFKDVVVPYPSVSEQTQIANFLDHKTQQIDDLISVKERKIELLQEYRASLINKAVTKGLDPNVEMKPSDVEWIGKIPRHWKAKKLGYVSTIFKGGTPKRNVDRYFQGELPWARPVDITALKGAMYIDDTKIHISEEALGNSGARRIPVGTVLLTSRATIGETAITTVPMATNQGFANFVCNEELSNVYLAYYLRAIKDVLISLGSGSTFLEVTKRTLLGVGIPLPPLAEQTQIINFLDRKTKQIDELRFTEEQTIKLLKEYRQSLISAVVTGKIDVRNEV